MTRLIASVVVMALLAPPMATITCEIVCELTGADAPAMATVTCHEHHARHQGPSMTSTNSGPCHDADQSPAAVLGDSLQLSSMPVPVVATEIVAALAYTPARVLWAPPRSPGVSLLTSQLRI